MIIEANNMKFEESQLEVTNDLNFSFERNNSDFGCVN